MSKSLLSCRILLSFFFVLQMSPCLLYSQSWRVKNRLQTSYEYDDNILESPPSDSLKNLTDSSYKFLFHSRASRKTGKSYLRLNYQGGLQNYFENSIENKLINDLSGYGLLSLQNIQFGIDVSGRLKLYLNKELDYASGAAEAFLVMPQIYKITNKLAIKTGTLDYREFSLFDYDFNRLLWTISANLYKKLFGQITLQSQRISYKRAALTRSFDFKPDKQEDDLLGIKLNLNYTKSVLLNFSYLLEDNRSNSFGYSYNKHQFIFILGVPFAGTFWLRGYGALQIKRYDEKSLPVFPIDADTEREESNFLILDISKDFSPNLSGLFRFAYYNNESTIRGRFYNKVLFSGGLDFRF